MRKETFRQYGDYDTDAVSDATGLECRDPSLAIQSQKDEADINTIVRNFGLTGKIPDVVYMPEYGDYTDVTDYRGAVEAIRQAEEGFLTLPGEVRARFENSPQAFMEFVHDPSNAEELVNMGLRVRPVVEAPPAPMPVMIVNPTPGSDAPA